MPLSTLALALTLAGAPASADSPEPAEVAPAATEEPAPALDTAEAEPLGYLTPNKLAFLKPKRGRLPQNPYGSIDFTAYALEWGEWRVGLGSVMVGVAPRVQLGTAPVLDALGVYNASAKANLLRLGPVDLAVGGAYYTLPTPIFYASWAEARSTLSVRLANPWSLHVTGSYVDIRAKGSPDTNEEISQWIVTQAAGDDLSGQPESVRAEAEARAATAQTAVDAHGRAATLRVATDIRFNRRDSLVLQGSAMLWGALDTDVGSDLPPILGLNEALDTSTEERLPIAQTYVASAAWQMQWKRLELRIGGGISSVPGAWLLQSTDLAWRFGGKTRASERRVRQAWRRDKRATRRGGGDALAAAPMVEAPAE